MVGDHLQEFEVRVVRAREIKLEVAGVLDRFFPSHGDRFTGDEGRGIRGARDTPARTGFEASIVIARRSWPVGAKTGVRECE